MIRAITVCVEYHDILAHTLPRMLSVMDHVTVVTSLSDFKTERLVKEARASGQRVHLHQTEVFYLQGCAFNKGRAINEAMEAMNLRGWMAVIDADTCLPRDFHQRLTGLDESCLYSARRRMAPISHLDHWAVRSDEWESYPINPDHEHGGWLQIFHASFMSGPPWYPTVWRHAGGCDSGFMLKWKRAKRRWLDGEVLHIGEDGTNWFGRVSAMADGQDPDASGERSEAMKAMLARREAIGKRAFSEERTDGAASARS